MPDVVHEDGGQDGLCLRVEDVDTFLAERLHGFRHQVEGSQRVLEAGMAGTGVNYRSQSQLVDAVKSLKQRMLHDVVQQSAFNLDEPEDGVVNNLVLVQYSVSILLTFCHVDGLEPELRGIQVADIVAILVFLHQFQILLLSLFLALLEENHTDAVVQL